MKQQLAQRQLAGELKSRAPAPYKQQQQATRDRMQMGTLLVPTLPTRIARLNPAERGEVQRIIKSMKLRKVIRRVLAEAHWEREVQQLQHSVRSMHGLRRSLLPTLHAQTFVPQFTRTESLGLVSTRANETQLLEMPR
jgi:hypothetical protein